MADIKKFLDQVGITHLWKEITIELNKKADISRVIALENKIAALEANNYDDTEVRGLINDNANAIDALEARIDAAEIDIDTLKDKVTT